MWGIGSWRSLSETQVVKGVMRVVQKRRGKMPCVLHPSPSEQTPFTNDKENETSKNCPRRRVQVPVLQRRLKSWWSEDRYFNWARVLGEAL